MDYQDVLIGEQLKHMVDMMDAKLERIELNQEHLKELIEHRLDYIEKQTDDHETRIRAATENAVFEYDNQVIPVTVSVGLASYTANDRAPALVRRADEALYQAKNTGRNRVVTSDK